MLFARRGNHRLQDQGGRRDTDAGLMRFQRQPTKGFIAFVAGAMAVTSLIFTAVTWSKMNASIDASQHAMLMKAGWERTFSALKDAETGQRGFQITGDETYLEPFMRSVVAVPRDLDELVTADHTEAVSSEDVSGIRRLVDEKFAELREAISIRKREGPGPAQEFISAGGGKRIMDELRHRVEAVTSRLDGIIIQKNAVMRSDQKWGLISATGSGVVALGAGALALMLFRESLKQLRREERLAAAKVRAEQSEKEKSIFLATMSHEIRTPMNAILGFSELLANEAQSEQEKRHAETILVSGRALLQIINDILDLSKIEAGMLQISSDPCDVRDVVRFVQQMFARQAIERGLELHTEISPTVPNSLLIDSIRLRQILVNVVGNSLKFTERGGVTMRLHGERDTEHRSRMLLTVEVEDTGVGIPREMQAEVFRPFVQVNGGTKSQTRGTGLGLAIVKRLSDLMGGRILLDSQPGRGTLFRFEFPHVEISARLPESQTKEHLAVDFNKLRPSKILAVDDNPTNRSLVADIFASTHHKILLAASGSEAVRTAVNERPDVVLMDIRMPEMDGREAMRLIRQQPELELLPLVAVTASSLSHEEQALRRSFDGYIRKPFSLAELYRELAQFIPQHSSMDSVLGVSEVPRPASAEIAALWRELAPRLKDLEKNVWPGVIQGMAMSDVQSFSNQLAGLARSCSCPPLEHYAQKLMEAAESFALAALENQLGQFPALTSQLTSASIPDSDIAPPA
jgi:signal transduction histidine kinase/DNA-binding NarL/FixJ family response regulator